MRNYRNYTGRRRTGGRWLKALLALLLAGAVVFGGLVGLVLAGGRDDVQGEPGVMIVLGCQVKPWGPSILLQDRLDRALDWLDDHPDTVVVVSGGQGPDEPSTEARAMRDYLVEKGFPGSQILEEDQSHNTIQNLTRSAELLTKEGYDITDGVVIVSNGFHLTRVRMLWSRVIGDGEGLSTLAAPSSHVPSRLKMYVREPLALVKSFLFDRV